MVKKTKMEPTFEVKALETEDAGHRCFDAVFTAKTLRGLREHHLAYVIDSEQRGEDPVTNDEVLNKRKMEDWQEMELESELHVGQITFCTHSESGTTYEWDTDKGTLRVYGSSVIPDGRQRFYTVTDAEQKFEDGLTETYDPDRKVSVRIYVDLDSDERRELFNQMNGGRGGDHADQGRVEWLSPRGSAVIAKRLVSASPHLGTENVNVVKNKITKKDHRLAGFNTFVNAVGNAWNKPLPTKEEKKIGDFLIDYWSKLVEVLPQLEVLPLGDRLKVREETLIGNPLSIYGFMAVARRIYDMDPENPPIERLEEIDPEWFDIEESHWKDIGVLAPSLGVDANGKPKVKGYKVRNAFQTRKAFADFLVNRMFGEDEAAAA